MSVRRYSVSFKHHENASKLYIGLVIFVKGSFSSCHFVYSTKHVTKTQTAIFKSLLCN